MAEIQKVYQITSLPGIKRDGTVLDGDNFTGGQWVRFNRGRARKMGGYQEVNSPLPGTIRAMQVWSRGGLNALVTACASGITQSNVDNSGGAGTTYDRTPVGFTTLDGCWTMDNLYDEAAGSENTILVAHRNNALDDIDEQTDYPVYWGVISDTTPLQAISGLSVSGGIVAIAPYLVYYGSNGQVGWSDVNQPQTLNSGDAGQDRVTGSKIVKGLPLRASSGPACILWSLDSVIRMDWVGGDAIFRFSTLSNQSSILSQNSAIEYDGDYFWVGVDRFMAYSGGKVQELPNQMNKNWFFDNLNFDQRQKVWATKVPRFGEIIWFFPFGDSEECTNAVVFNILEKTWYDFELSRSAGYYSQVFRYPTWCGTSSTGLVRVVLSTLTGAFEVGDSVVLSRSLSAGTVYVKEDTDTILVKLNNPDTEPGDIMTNLSQSGSGTVDSIVVIDSAYIHEKGKNSVLSNSESAINSYIETSDFGYPTGGSQPNGIEGLNRWTRLIRVEPDFIMSGDMTMQVIGREFAQQDDTASSEFTFSSSTGKIDVREQRRQIRLKFSSNTLGGHFEMGRVILHIEPGDIRS